MQLASSVRPSLRPGLESVPPHVAAGSRTGRQSPISCCSQDTGKSLLRLANSGASSLLDAGKREREALLAALLSVPHAVSRASVQMLCLDSRGVYVVGCDDGVAVG